MKYETYKVVIQVGPVSHTEVVKSANANTAVKRVATTIKNTIQKLECITPNATVYRDAGNGVGYVLAVEFPDIRMIFK